MNHDKYPYIFNCEKACDGCINYLICGHQEHNIVICPILMQIRLWMQNDEYFTTEVIIRNIRGASTYILHILIDYALPTEIHAVILDELNNRETYRNDTEMRL